VVDLACAIALDIGGSSVKSALVTQDRRLINTPLITPLDSSANAEHILGNFAKIIIGHILQARMGQITLVGIGIGFPGPFDYENGISYITGTAKYESIYGLNVREALSDRLPTNLPIRFRNDAEAAIIGEARYGAGRNYTRLIGLTLGTGCGSAFVVGGVPVTNGQGVPPNGWVYPVEFQGKQADDVFSVRGLIARMREAGFDVTDDLEHAANAARRGNSHLQQVYTQFGRDLGLFLRPFIADFGAEAVLILGGIAGAYDLFGPALVEMASIATLTGEFGVSAALLGAADLVLTA
jgi:glucokinase